MKYQYDTSAAAVNYTKTFDSKHRRDYKLDNVYIKFPSIMTGAIRMTIDSDEGAGYDIQVSKAISAAALSNVFYTGLEISMERGDSVVISTSGYAITGSCSVRIGTIDL